MMRHQDYRALLLDELRLRQESRPGFSMNAFARFIGLSPSHLNDVFKRRRGLSIGKARNISQKLGLVDHEEEFFIMSIKSLHSRSKRDREEAQTSLEKIKSQEVSVLQLDLFALISQWQHFAILELSRLPGFKFSEKWISNKLGIDVSVARDSMRRLESLKLLREKGGKWFAHKGFLKTVDDIPSQAIRSHHTEILNLARNAIHTQSVDTREFNTTMLTIDKSNISLAKKMVRKFQSDVSFQLSKPGQKRNSLYCMAVQFFELTKDAE